MADVKISALTGAVVLTGAEKLPIVQSGATVGLTISALLASSVFAAAVRAAMAAPYSCVADVGIDAGQPIYVKANGHAELAGAGASGTATVAGFATASATSGNTVSWTSDGLVTLADWTAVAGSASLTPGARYFLSTTAGQITTTAPTTPGQSVVSLGVAASGTTLDIEIQPPIAL